VLLERLPHVAVHPEAVEPAALAADRRDGHVRARSAASAPIRVEQIWDGPG